MSSFSKEFQFVLSSRLILVSLTVYLSVLITRILFLKEDQTLTVFFNSWLLEGLFFCSCLSAGGIFHDIATKKPSNYMPYSTIFKAYIKGYALYLLGWWSYRKFLNTSTGVRVAQENWLMREIQRRKDTAYGKDHDFAAIKTVEDFRCRLPVSGYEEYRKYADRAALGEENVILPEKTAYIILTSGTTGSNKKFPLSYAGMFEFVKNSLSLPIYIGRKKDPASFTLKKPLLSWVTPPVMTNEVGMRMGAASGCGKFDPGCLTPFCALREIKSEPVIMYIHAVLGLLREDLDKLDLVFLARSFFVTLETRWKDMLEDIKTGTLNSDLDLSPEMRKNLESEMWANPERAEKLRYEFSRGFDNIIPRVLPEIHHISMLASASLQTPALTLQKKYFPGVPVWNSVHSASEGLYGICLDPGDIKKTYFTMMPQCGFYEFIPIEAMEEPQPKPKLMHELEVGCQYELCMTTLRGICRYRTGYIIKVVSFFNETPQYEFIGRYGQILNLCGEKTTEIACTTAVECTLSKLDDFALVDFTTAENSLLDGIEVTENKKYYILFIELDPRKAKIAYLTEEQKTMFDEDMQVHNESYKDFRKEGRIEKMIVIQTKPGAFAILKEQILTDNPKASSGQFKTPRSLRRKKDIELMVGLATQPWEEVKF